MGGYAFRWPELLRWGFLGVVTVLFAGAVLPPRPELRSVWITCLCLAVCQTALTVACGVEYPFACNQNMRFFAQAFAPLAGIFGLGFGRLRRGGGGWGRSAWLLIMVVFPTGAADFYARRLL